MFERQVGIVVSGHTVTVVVADVPQDHAQPITVISDTSWSLQKGERPEAYAVMFRRCVNFMNESDVGRVILKASSSTRNAATKALLESAEVRGVVIAAAASVVPVTQLAKERISRHYGERKFDDYCKDDSFWDEHAIGGKLRKNSRAAAMLVIANRG